MANVKVLIGEKDGVELDKEEYVLLAEDVPFDPIGTTFTSTNTQDAIEEAKQNAEGFPRAGIRSTYNGILPNNQFIGPTELLPNTPLLTLPVNTKLNEITWANQSTNRVFQIEFYKNGKTAGNLFYTLTVTSPNSGYGYVSGLNFTFAAGDVIYAKSLGSARMSDGDLVLWISRIP